MTLGRPRVDPKQRRRKGRAGPKAQKALQFGNNHVSLEAETGNNNNAPMAPLESGQSDKETIAKLEQEVASLNASIEDMKRAHSDSLAALRAEMEAFKQAILASHAK